MTHMDYDTDKPPLCDRWCYISFGSSGGSSSSSQTQTSNRGLSPSQKGPLSAYTEPAIQDLYNYAMGYLQPTQAQMRRYDASGPTLVDRAPGTPAGKYNDMMTDPNAPIIDHSRFALPSLNANGLYAGQTQGAGNFLQDTYRNLGLNPADASGALGGLLQSISPATAGLAGAQTEAGVQIPEQVRQARVAQVENILGTLFSPALGGSSAGTGYSTNQSSSMNMGLFNSGIGGQFASGFVGAGMGGGSGASAGGGAQAAGANFYNSPNNPIQFCWIAMEVYGPDSPKVTIVRSYLIRRARESLGYRVLVRLYRRYGQAIASWLHTHPWAKRYIQPLFDRWVNHG